MIIGSILTGENVIWDGLSSVERRTVSQIGSEYEALTRERAITTNIDAFFKTPATVVFVIFCIIIIFSIIWLLVKFKRDINYLKVIKNHYPQLKVSDF